MGRANIKDDGVKFSKENQPPGERKSRKGIPNRATVYKRFLDLKTTARASADAKTGISVTLYEAAALGQIIAAQQGNTQAWKEIQDSLHGKLPDKTEHSFDFSNLTDEELVILEQLRSKLNSKP